MREKADGILLGDFKKKYGIDVDAFVFDGKYGFSAANQFYCECH
jgi:hypothetical protein